MSPASETDGLLGAFVQELARCGLRAACTSPGSRCAPLVLALARDQRLRCFSHIDERCAGFFALGLAKASHLPVALTCTSGTAVAELLPAVVEAREARVPLIVLSADRPPELREVGAGQTIDQLGIFGRYAKWFFDVGVPEPGAASERWLRTLACRAYWTALEGRPGVVHLNFALREPLVSERLADAALEARAESPGGGRPDGRPLVTRPAARAVLAEEAESLAAAVAGCRRGVVVAGRHERDTPLGEAAAAFCATAGWPLLADPLSGARRGEAAIAHYDAMLRDETFCERMRPDIVLRVGDLPTSKPLRQWLAAMPEVPQATIDSEGVWPDPDATLCRVFALDPAAALAALRAPRGEEDWLVSWRDADQRAAGAIRATLSGDGGAPAGGDAPGAGDTHGGGNAPAGGHTPSAGGTRGKGGAPASGHTPSAGDTRGESLSEPLVAAELGALLPERATLFVASSMPVRDVETFWPVRADPPRVLCNRGANGIDGTISSAFGAAAADDGPVVLLIGDVALAHDIGGLLAATRLGSKLTIVLVNNEGGGIFDFLPVAQAPAARAPIPETDTARTGEHDLYTRHIATPTGLDFAKAAELYELGHEPVSDLAGFRAALERALTSPRSILIEVRSEREANVALHRRVWDAVSESLAS
jgi:2-succinyl-5-enolpyruvyl-6-hydroxy-3-cyclohexene-1-carboxylate synthase